MAWMDLSRHHPLGLLLATLGTAGAVVLGLKIRPATDEEMEERRREKHQRDIELRDIQRRARLKREREAGVREYTEKELREAFPSRRVWTQRNTRPVTSTHTEVNFPHVVGGITDFRVGDVVTVSIRGQLGAANVRADVVETQAHGRGPKFHFWTDDLTKLGIIPGGQMDIDYASIKRIKRGPAPSYENGHHNGKEKCKYCTYAATFIGTPEEEEELIARLEAGDVAAASEYNRLVQMVCVDCGHVFEKKNGECGEREFTITGPITWCYKFPREKIEIIAPLIEPAMQETEAVLDQPVPWTKLILPMTKGEVEEGRKVRGAGHEGGAGHGLLKREKGQWVVKINRDMAPLDILANFIHEHIHLARLDLDETTVDDLTEQVLAGLGERFNGDVDEEIARILRDPFFQVLVKRWKPRGGDFRGMVGPWIRSCRQACGTPMFRTRWGGVPFGPDVVLGICYGGCANAPRGMWFSSVPTDVLAGLRSKKLTWRELQERF